MGWVASSSEETKQKEEKDQHKKPALRQRRTRHTEHLCKSNQYGAGGRTACLLLTSCSGFRDAATAGSESEREGGEAESAKVGKRRASDR